MQGKPVIYYTLKYIMSLNLELGIHIIKRHYTENHREDTEEFLCW